MPRRGPVPAPTAIEISRPQKVVGVGPGGVAGKDPSRLHLLTVNGNPAGIPATVFTVVVMIGTAVVEVVTSNGSRVVDVEVGFRDRVRGLSGP